MSKVSRRGFVAGAALAPLALRAVAQQTRGGAAPGEQYDYVIAGAGHNSLLCAAYLAKAGNRVLVLEGRPTVGGGVKTSEVLLPGFKEDLCSSVHNGIAANPAIRDHEIDLRDYGYETMDPDVVLHIPFLDGSAFTIYREDVERTAATIARVSKKDAATFKRLAASRELVSSMPADERAKSRDGIFWNRLGDLSGYDAACQIWQSPQMRAASLTAGHFGGVPGSDPGTGTQAISMIGHLSGRRIPKGGSGMLTIALSRFIEANNGVVLTNKPVGQLIIENGRCAGVECLDGSRYRGRKGVVSTIHVKHLIDMAPRELWGDALLDKVDIWQPEHSMFSFHFALSEPPRYRLPDGGTLAPCEAAIMQDASSIFVLNLDRARGELNVEDYPLQIVHPSNVDPSRVPAGYGAVKIEGTMPYELKEGAEHWDAVKEEVADKVLTRYMRHTDNLSKDKVLAKVIMSPLDIERMNPSMWRGSVHHSVRSLGNFAPYRMPIPGLYQTGGCTAPGGSVTGRPGRAAAAVILEDDGKTLEQVVGKRVHRA
jgi:phytoene dehydrogenase-like protein